MTGSTYVNASGNPQTVPYGGSYGTAGSSGTYGQPGVAYGTTGAATGAGYNSPYNSGTGVRQEYKQTVTQIGPGQTTQSTYKETSGPAGGTYQRTTVEQNRGSNYATAAVPVTTTTNTYPSYQQPVTTTNTYSTYQQPVATSTYAAPVTTTTYQRPVAQPVVVTQQPVTKNRCPKPLLGLLGLLGLAGVILGLLFGLGVIGGKRGDLTPPTAGANPGYTGADAVAVDGVGYEPNTVTT